MESGLRSLLQKKKKVQFQDALLCFRSGWSHHHPCLACCTVSGTHQQHPIRTREKHKRQSRVRQESSIVHMFSPYKERRGRSFHFCCCCIHQRQSQTRQSFIISLAVIPILGRVQCIYTTWSRKSCSSSSGNNGEKSVVLLNGEQFAAAAAASAAGTLSSGFKYVAT